LPTIEESDYFYLLHLFSEVDEGEEKMSAEDFFKKYAKPEDIEKLNN
jgi:hypothetical protein